MFVRRLSGLLNCKCNKESTAKKNAEFFGRSIPVIGTFLDLLWVVFQCLDYVFGTLLRWAALYGMDSNPVALQGQRGVLGNRPG